MPPLGAPPLGGGGMPPLGAPPPLGGEGGLLLPPCTADSLHAAVKSVAKPITRRALSHVDIFLEDPLCFIISRLLRKLPGGNLVEYRPTLKGPTSLGLSK